jgi:hypothetical protein
LSWKPDHPYEWSGCSCWCETGTWRILGYSACSEMFLDSTGKPMKNINGITSIWKECKWRKRQRSYPVTQQKYTL